MTTQYVTVQASGAEGYSNLKVWLRDVAPVCPGVQRSVLKRQLILACREFFAESFAWQADQGPIPVVAGQNTYQLSPFNSYTDTVGILQVNANGLPLRPIWKRPALLTSGGGDNTLGTSDLPTGFYMLRPDIIAIFPTPITPLPQPVTLQVRCALKPKTTVEQVPLIAQTHFYEAILAGLLYRLLNQPAKPYTNMELSMYYEKRFRSYIGEYAAKAKTGFNGASSWFYPGFGK
jgi:hypothetical protein